jgi:hypothetical protein
LKNKHSDIPTASMAALPVQAQFNNVLTAMYQWMAAQLKAFRRIGSDGVSVSWVP